MANRKKGNGSFKIYVKKPTEPKYVACLAIKLMDGEQKVLDRNIGKDKAIELACDLLKMCRRKA